MKEYFIMPESVLSVAESLKSRKDQNALISAAIRYGLDLEVQDIDEKHKALFDKMKSDIDEAWREHKEKKKREKALKKARRLKKEAYMLLLSNNEEMLSCILRYPKDIQSNFKMFVRRIRDYVELGLSAPVPKTPEEIEVWEATSDVYIECAKIMKEVRDICDTYGVGISSL